MWFLGVGECTLSILTTKSKQGVMTSFNDKKLIYENVNFNLRLIGLHLRTA